MGKMIDMTEGEAEYLKYRFKQYLGSVSRAIQNKRLEEQKMGMTIDDDYRRFCLNCGWNDSDFGCTSPSGEEVWQCPMYIHYHPEEVKKFNEAMNKWEQEKYGNVD